MKIIEMILNRFNKITRILKEGEGELKETYGGFG